MLVDSHGHVSTKRFDGDRDEVLARARAAGLVAMLDVGCDLPSSRASLALAERDPLVWATVGVHPHEAKEVPADFLEQLRALAAHPRVVAIGEMGLDFYYDHSPRDEQRRVFRAQLELARELDLPAVLHVRDAYGEAAEIVDEVPGVRGVSHCFTGTAAEAELYWRRGFGVSFTGVVTFKSAEQVREAAKGVPPELLLVETDCPFMAPVPLRGKRCEPAHVVHTARMLAEVRGEDPDVLMRRTAENALRIFGISLPA
ncbi:MAG: TatD family hydrolase [Planctomycetes bacterium]|nr:TatD family hydrolase [Planctomycetota bacterium]